MQPNWLALMIGNSRLHWASFVDETLQQTWDTPHCAANDLTTLSQDLITLLQHQPELWMASVVPTQSLIWQSFPDSHLISLNQVPLRAMYPTFGIDRALALWGAVSQLGSPTLVIDAGTALTLTGVNEAQELMGGAILPGLRLQFQALNQGTAALPVVQFSSGNPLPPRWAKNTPDAIASGILYTLVAGLQDWIRDWRMRHPGSRIVLTGGDGDRLAQLLLSQEPALTHSIQIEPNLIFWGIQSVRKL